MSSALPVRDRIPGAGVLSRKRQGSKRSEIRRISDDRRERAGARPPGPAGHRDLAGRSIDRIEKNGKRTVLADRWDGKRFGGTNDVVVKRDGAIYFTDTLRGIAACARRTRPRSSTSTPSICGRTASSRC